MNGRRQRSPPGTWRLFAPALAGWAACAASATVPGTAGYLFWGTLLGAAAACGIAVVRIVVIRIAVVRAAVVRAGAVRPPGHRPGRATRRAQAVTGAGLVLCAVLLILTSRVLSEEGARQDPALRAEAASGASTRLSVTLAGFPQRGASLFGERSWVPGFTRTPSGSVPVLLRVRGESGADWAPGLVLRVTGRLDRLPLGGAAYAVNTDEVRIEAQQSLLGDAGRVAAGLRASLRLAAAGMPGAELVPGFAVGDTALVGEELDAAMRQSSLTHLTAVSGANCALVTAVAIRLLGLLGVGRRVRVGIAGAALLGFLLVVGPDPSVQRATLMAGVLLVSDFGGKRAVALPSLGVAMIVLLAIDPWQALRPGFALSVAATAGILLIANPLSGWLHRVTRIPNWLSLPLGVALAAQLACGPLLLLVQSGVPAVGVLANAVAGPAAPLGTGLGLLALLLLPIGGPIGELVVGAAVLPAQWVAATARIAATLPLARWAWPEGWTGAALLAICEGLLLAAWALAHGRISVPGGGRAARRSPWRVLERSPRAVRVLSAMLVALGLGIATSVALVAPAMERVGVPGDWAIVACDVGQGDALLLRDPADPTGVMLVDTGNDAERLETCLGRFGVHRISLLVLTHDDADHVGALDAVVDRVDIAMIAPTVSGERTEGRRVVQTLGRAAVATRIGAAGDRGTKGGKKPGGLHWQVLAPAVDAAPADSNGASLVMLVDAGPIRVLMLADTGFEEQSALLATGEDLRAEVLKVAHHGSSDQDPELPPAVDARWGLVSVGAENRYGHPTRASLDSLRAAGTRALRTDRCGSIALTPSGEGEIGVWVERGVADDAPERASPVSAAGHRLEAWQHPRRRSRSSVTTRRVRHRSC